MKLNGKSRSSVIITIVAPLVFTSYLTLAEDTQPLGPKETLGQLKGKRIIAVQDYPHDKTNPLDQFGWPEVNKPTTEYDRNYPKRLKNYFGVELIKVDFPELDATMKSIDKEKATEIARTWVADARTVENVSNGLLEKNATLYLSLKKLLEKYDGDAISVTTWYFSGHMNPKGAQLELKLPMSILELSKEHVPSSCQCHIDCLTTMLIGKLLTGGYMGFDGDVLNEGVFKPIGKRPENAVVIAHCGAPINPHGTDRMSYYIRDHVDPPGCAPTYDWPEDEPVTLVKFDVYRKKMSVFTGRALDGPALYQDFDNAICRNKVVVQLDNPDSSYLLPVDPEEGAFRDWFGSWGCHQVLFYGDWKETFEQFAELAGFQIVE